MSMTQSSDASTRSIRPSQLIAESLVDGHDQGQIAERARRHGYSSSLTNIVVTACCGTTEDHDEPPSPHREPSSPPSS